MLVLKMGRLFLHNIAYKIRKNRHRYKLIGNQYSVIHFQVEY